ncbi:YL1-domain-containing protein [Xylariaceae sp. AK1471]|nr:YL1-domain-containing protein [Xylariaceae sp. AK1471]
MATTDEKEQHTQVNEEENDVLSSDSSDIEDDVSGDEETSPKVEWLATGRERRSTAGNRLKSMIAAEEPDDELELLFAEDADDAGFTDVGDDGSDAQMSSSEDEDAQENGDELEGEQELEKHARESRQAARKRKAQEVIPLKFRKKVKIDVPETSSAGVTPTAPQPRPKKKSERASWLPSPADMPIRASRRETTIAGKEQLHKQMVEREVKRLKQIEAMERKAKKMEALKKPPMTQAERLAEAALVEKRNAKSLNRWEEAEKQREEERKAKLAALNNRTLEGPVVTFWSGMGEWIDGKLKHVGKIVTIEEKPAKKKRPSAVGHEGTTESARQDKAGQTHIHTSLDNTSAVEPGPPSSKDTSAKPELAKESVVPDAANLAGLESEKPAPSMGVGQETQPTRAVEMTLAVSPIPRTIPTIQAEGASTTLSSHGQDSKPLDNDSQSQIPPPADMRPPDLQPPNLQPPSTNLYTTSMFAPPTQSSVMKPPELKPPPNSFLAPPAGVSQSGLSMPMIGYHSSLNSTNPSNVLAPPNPAQRQSPLSMPQTNIQPPPPPPAPTPTRPTQTTSTPKLTASTIPSTAPSNSPAPSHRRPPPKTPQSTPKPTKGNGQKHQPKEVAPPPPRAPPANGKATRNCIILQNFNENAVKDKSVQTRILFGRDMNRLPKQGPPPRCVITNHPARYRDPKTGLPYYNAYAFKEIQKLYSGKYRWSTLVGAWIGSGTSAAIGVPARFVNPNAPKPVKELSPPDPPTKNDEVTDCSKNKDAEPETAEKQPVEALVLSAPVTTSQPGSNTPAAAGGLGIEPDKAFNPLITGESSSNTRPYVATTEASFALNTDYITPLNTSEANNTMPRTIDSTGTVRPASVVEVPPDPLGPHTAIGGSPLTSPAPVTLAEQGAANP